MGRGGGAALGGRGRGVVDLAAAEMQIDDARRAQEGREADGARGSSNATIEIVDAAVVARLEDRYGAAPEGMSATTVLEGGQRVDAYTNRDGSVQLLATPNDNIVRVQGLQGVSPEVSFTRRKEAADYTQVMADLKANPSFKAGGVARKAGGQPDLERMPDDRYGRKRWRTGDWQLTNEGGRDGWGVVHLPSNFRALNSSQQRKTRRDTLALIDEIAGSRDSRIITAQNIIRKGR